MPAGRAHLRSCFPCVPSLCRWRNRVDRTGPEVIVRESMRTPLLLRFLNSDDAHVLRSFERARVGTVFVAQAAFELFDGFVFVLAHPVVHLFLNDAKVLDALPHERGTQHRYIRADHKHLDGIRTTMNAARGREAGADAFVENRNPAHRQAHGHRRAVENIGRDFE